MNIDSYENGIHSWVDASVPDLDQARAFYGALFGWETPPGPPEAGGYSVCTYKGRNVAGLGPQMVPGVPPAWLVYANVDSVDDTVRAITENGGQVFAGPMDVMEAGRMAVFADPQGAVSGLWEPKEHKGAQIVNEPNTFAWSELITTDLDGAKDFYGAIFGWDALTQGPEGGPSYTEWKVNDRSIGGMMLKNENMPAEMPPNWGIYFAVDDCDQTVSKASSLGGSVFMPPMDIEPGRFAVLADPGGAVFNVLAMKEGLGE
jgi:uncharacterized protein